ncbi:DUF4908 domain-containing protein [Parvularcula sp. IMCC14364]|uniref:DUF4908 domain-containing protein n=1 Tax=Parvularcula sp. IMCC14364 TaxID=3067902 RepID=UPI0027413A5E|nr:DUF4908 domain-containing protein [Parvularcula sp. IMCC14364]
MEDRTKSQADFERAMRTMLLSAFLCFCLWCASGPAFGLASGSALAQQDGDGFSDVSSLPDIDPFSALLNRRGPSAVRLSSREPQLYETAQGDTRFTLQVSGQTALLRFHCDENDASLECWLLQGQPHEEILLLRAGRSPRGDVTYKNRRGEAVLRVTATGGATLYDPEETALTDLSASSFGAVVAGGAAVLPVVSRTQALVPPAMSVADVDERMRQVTSYLIEKYDFFISFMSVDSPPASQSVLGDAVLTAAKAIDLVASDSLGQRAVSRRLQAVEFRPRDVAGVAYADATLIVYYSERNGVAGRPSSAEIRRYLESVL